jgi:hypothetical protein
MLNTKKNIDGRFLDHVGGTVHPVETPLQFSELPLPLPAQWPIGPLSGPMPIIFILSSSSRKERFPASGHSFSLYWGATPLAFNTP